MAFVTDGLQVLGPVAEKNAPTCRTELLGIREKSLCCCGLKSFGVRTPRTNSESCENVVLHRALPAGLSALVQADQMRARRPQGACHRPPGRCEVSC